MKYDDIIKDLKSEKREALYLILKDYIILYLKVLFLMPNELNKRTQLGLMVLRYIKYDRNELKILNLIKEQFTHKEDIEELENILEELDDMFNELYNYCDNVFYYYEDMLLTHERYRAIVPKIDFEVMNDETTANFVKKIINISQK